MEAENEILIPRSQEEYDVFAEYRDAPENVIERWALYDTIVISPTWYGNESTVGGWFPSLAAFGAQETHSFFKGRNRANAGGSYCNMNATDQLDFPFIVDSMGLEFSSPSPNIEGERTPADGFEGALRFPDALIGHFFAVDLPNHCAIELISQQDSRAMLQAAHCPPGYGPMGGGIAFQHHLDASVTLGDIPFMFSNVTQGVPVMENRYKLPNKIGIPRTGNIEGVLHVGELARSVLEAVAGPRNFQFNSEDGTYPYTFFHKRYFIRFSLFGVRLVQQRGKYHR